MNSTRYKLLIHNHHNKENPARPMYSYRYIRKSPRVIITALFALLLLVSAASAQLNYGVIVGRGERMDAEFKELQYNNNAGYCQTEKGNGPSNDMIEIGFPFMFDNVYYKEINVNSNGLLSFGGPIKDARTNSLNDVSAPVLAPFWDMMYVPASERDDCVRPGVIRFGWTGGKAQRILVIDYYDMSLTQGCDTKTGYVPVQFQVRLYEGSNKIEFFYENMDPMSPDCYAGRPTSTSASIGLAAKSGILSVAPVDGSDITVNDERDEANVNLQTDPISSGMLYSFCPANMVGNPKQGGTPGMRDGDILLEGTNLVVYTEQSFRPFTFISPCASTFSYAIIGDNAGDYSINPTEGKLEPEKGNTPTLTFSPTGAGPRTATLIVMDDLGYVARSYELAGEGTGRIIYIGDVDQGGTPTLEDGDILMQDIKVRNGESGSFTPITIQVSKSNRKDAPAAPVTYTLIDPSGQFFIDRVSEDVPPGGSSTPVITFAPNGHVDVQSAKLIVDAEGIVREFELRPFASGPGARFTIDGEPYGNGSAVFRGNFGCVGESVSNAVFTVQAIGDESFVMEGLNAFRVTTEISQGNSPAPILRDPFGAPMEVGDYFLTDAPGSSKALEFPIRLEPGETKTFYLTFVPTRPGKRAARTFFRTNGENFQGFDVERESVWGMLNMEMVGHGMGAALSNRMGASRQEPVVFPATDVRNSVTAVSYIYNNGDCDMRISRDRFRLVAGDIKDFAVVAAFDGASVDPATGDYLIPPGGMDSIVVSFTPTRSGSRRASLRLATNDSLLYVGGVIARGEYYIDLFGVGNVGLEARTLVLPPAVIDGPSSSGQALLENTSADLLEIVKIEVVSGTGEIAEDAANPWPSLPLTLVPGQKTSLGLTLTPDPANGTGERTALVEVTLANGNVLTIDVRGLVGMRTLSVTPAALFQGAKVPVGEAGRAYALVTNTGTFPVQLQSYQISGANKDDYSLGTIKRGVIQPGETLPIDVMYTPSVQGMSSATLELVTNTTNGSPAGTHVVQLGGEGTSTSPIGDPQGSTITIPTAGDGLSRTGVSAGNNVAARLYEIAPNPVRGSATFRYELSSEGNTVLGLYDLNGRLVRELASGTQAAGEHGVTVDLSGLPAGSYYVRLHVGDQVITRAVTLMK